MSNLETTVVDPWLPGDWQQNDSANLGSFGDTQFSRLNETS